MDPFDGTGDLQKRMIRCVGNPIERFTEDALRMMRAVRFSAQLGYEIEAETADAIQGACTESEEYQCRADSDGTGEAGDLSPIRMICGLHMKQGLRRSFFRNLISA